MQDGARLAIQSSALNDQHDVLKTKALAELVGQAFKLVKANQGTPASASFPALPVIEGGKTLLSDGTLDADFTIAGLDDEQTSDRLLRQALRSKSNNIRTRRNRQ